ncbi:MAG: EamA family transporter [Deltaproteobacteria bacterium]|nr:EamA family transporter [Deltaproteobacteria bacterium]
MSGAIMWASSGTAGKALFEGGVKAFDLVQIRVTSASIILFLFLAVFSRESLKIRAKDIGYFLLLGGIFMALVQGTYFYTISKIQVAAAILIQYLAPIFVAVYSMAFWREQATPFKIMALFLAFGGCYLVVGGYNLELLRMNRLGIMGGVSSAICFAGYSLLGEWGMHRYKPWTVLFYALVFSIPTWHILHPPFQYMHLGFDRFQWLWMLYIAVVGTILPFGLFFVGINHIRSTRASITATLEPISAGFLAFFLLGEKMEPLQILGGTMVIGAIVMLQIQQEQDMLTPAMIREEKRGIKRGGH